MQTAPAIDAFEETIGSRPTHAHYGRTVGEIGCHAACGYMFKHAPRPTSRPDFSFDPCPLCLEAMTGLVPPVICRKCRKPK